MSHNLSCFEWASIISEMTSSRPIHQCFWAWKRALGHVITSKSAQRDIFILFISWIFIQRYFSETMGLGKEENKDSESRKGQKYFFIYIFLFWKLISEYRSFKIINLWIDAICVGAVTWPIFAPLRIFSTRLIIREKNFFYMFHTLLVMNGQE